MHHNVRIIVIPSRVAATLLGVLLLLLTAHAVGLVLTYGFEQPWGFGLVPLFNIALEHNVPTFYASLLLLFNGFLFLSLWRLSSTLQEGKNVWLLLSLVFFFLAVDEFAMLHELLIVPVRRSLNVGGILFFAWTIPYTVAVIALAVPVTPVLWKLNGRFKLLFGGAAVMYLGGAIGVEMLGGRYYESSNEEVDLTYRLFQTVEELLEFGGLILLVYTLLELIGARAPLAWLEVEFRSRAAELTASARDRETETPAGSGKGPCPD